MTQELVTIEPNLNQENLSENVEKVSCTKKGKLRTRKLNWVEGEHVNKAVELYLQSLNLIDNDEHVYHVKEILHDFNKSYSVFLERISNE